MADGASLMQLVETLKLAPERIAIELNQSVVRRAEWSSRQLRENDRIEIVHFVGGGSVSHGRRASKVLLTPISVYSYCDHGYCC